VLNVAAEMDIKQLITATKEIVIANKEIIGTILGFFTGLMSAEFTEWRRRWIQKQNLRKSLKGELGVLELMLNVTLIQFFEGLPVSGRVVKEFRWFLDTGRKRFKGGMLLDDAMAGTLEKFTDDELKQLMSLKQHPLLHQTVKFPIPILQGVLSTLAPGFSTEEIASLSQLRWQLALLEKEIDMMDHFTDLSFTIPQGEQAHAIVVANRQLVEDGLRKRVESVLDDLRLTLPLFDQKSGLSAFFGFLPLIL
jgi:hypothetical protein